MDLIRLEHREHARLLVELVYATYGLTFHRDWLYDPDRMLELNALGDITSVIAMEDGQVIGHLAMIRPHFDVEVDSGPVCADDVRECGLSIVHPDHRSKGVQVALALRLSQIAWEEGIRGAIMRCVTHHTFSQRSARLLGGQPVALLLGSIPRWVSYDHDDPSNREPLSTLLQWVPVHPSGSTHALVRPPGMDWMERAVKGIQEVRTAPPSASVLPRESELCANWSGSKRLAQIHVTRVGRDLVSRLEETCRWLLGGHIAHISVFLPGDVPHLAAVHDELSALGLFPGGFIPGYLRGGRDAVVYQALSWSDLNPDRIKTLKGDSADILSSVLRARQQVGTRSALDRTLTGPIKVKRPA
jgi:GNAT superfamily N-acetyltransferase